MTSRRRFLAGLTVAATAPVIGWAAVGKPAYIAAAKAPDGRFMLAGLSHDGAETFRLPLPARGHAGAAHPTRAEAVAFARRPGTFALVIDVVRGQVRRRLTAPAGHEFNGHGVFVDAGAVLLTSEQVARGSAGRIGIWDVEAGYRRVGAFETHGLGPHEMRVMPGGGGLVVANGGIETEAGGRKKLNLATMQPNLAYLSTEGDLQELVQMAPELRLNSIRHLAVRGDGLVAFAMQWQGEPDMAWPLIGLHRRGTVPALGAAPLDDVLAMQDYAGSIAFAARGDEVAITSPRGNRVQVYSAAGTLLRSHTRADVCGLAPHGDGFLASDGFGGLFTMGSDGVQPLPGHDLAWDNHIVTL